MSSSSAAVSGAAPSTQTIPMEIFPNVAPCHSEFSIGSVTKITDVTKFKKDIMAEYEVIEKTYNSSDKGAIAQINRVTDVFGLILSSAKVDQTFAGTLYALSSINHTWFSASGLVFNNSLSLLQVIKQNLPNLDMNATVARVRVTA